MLTAGVPACFLRGTAGRELAPSRRSPGTRQCHFTGTNLKPPKLPENAHAAKQQSHHSDPDVRAGGCVERLMRDDNTFRTKVVTKIKRPGYTTRPGIMCVAAILSNEVMGNCPFA